MKRSAVIGHHEMRRHFKRYAAHFDLTCRNSRVMAIESAGGRFELQMESGEAVVIEGVRGGSNTRILDDQSEDIAAVASDAVTLPGREGMLAAIPDEHAWAEKQSLHSPRYGLDLRRYRKVVARDYARAGVAGPVGAAPSVRRAMVTCG